MSAATAAGRGRASACARGPSMSDMTRKVTNSAEVTACSGDPTMDSISVSHHQGLPDNARHVTEGDIYIHIINIYI